MEELKTDLFPGNLYAARERERQQKENAQRNAVQPVEPLPESERPRKDGPGGEQKKAAGFEEKPAVIISRRVPGPVSYFQ